MISILNAVSFTGKIPIGKCIIKDKATRSDVLAVCYEYDCKDKDDIKKFKKGQIGAPVPFHGQIEYVIEDKIENPDEYKTHHIYTIETEDGSIAANVHIEETESETGGGEIIQIGTNKTYGLAGRALIAQMGKDILKNKPNGVITAFAPVPDAVRFYTMDCGFKYNKNYTLSIDKNGIDNLCR